MAPRPNVAHRSSLTTTILATITSVPIFRHSQDALPEKYIVRLKDDADREKHLMWPQQQNPDCDDGSYKREIIYAYKATNGYGATLVGPVLAALTKCEDVKAISQDCQVRW